MFAILLKDLRLYTNSRKYRRIHFLILCALTLLLFVTTVEFYAQRRTGSLIALGQQVYTLFIIALFIFQFWVPRHAVEALRIERTSHPHLPGESANAALLQLTPITAWKILTGKLGAVVLWTVWSVWLAIPLLALSSYIGGLTISQLVKCGVVILASCLFFALIGIACALWYPPTRAKGISYGVVLAITFLPLLPISPFADIPILATLSPLRALLSIIHSGGTYLWVWNLCLFAVLFLLIFPISVRKLR